jgi:hypothetical protein
MHRSNTAWHAGHVSIIAKWSFILLLAAAALIPHAIWCTTSPNMLLPEEIAYMAQQMAAAPVAQPDAQGAQEKMR